jgi:hypothetical protein
LIFNLKSPLALASSSLGNSEPQSGLNLKIQVEVRVCPLGFGSWWVLAATCQCQCRLCSPLNASREPAAAEARRRRGRNSRGPLRLAVHRPLSLVESTFNGQISPSRHTAGPKMRPGHLEAAAADSEPSGRAGPARGYDSSNFKLKSVLSVHSGSAALY